jgi:hypothetical protein
VTEFEFGRRGRSRDRAIVCPFGSIVTRFVRIGACKAGSCMPDTAMIDAVILFDEQKIER